MSIDEMYIPDEVRSLLGDDKTAMFTFVRAVKAQRDLSALGSSDLEDKLQIVNRTRLDTCHAILHEAYPEQGKIWWYSRIQDAFDINRQQERARS
jgi:hypothetical protein